VDYAITLVAALLLGIGFVLQQQTAERAPESHFLSLRLLAGLFHKRKWLAGLVCMIAGQVLAAWSIGHLSLSVVEPLLTTNLLVALILAVPLSHQPVRLTEVVGALLLIAGETILSLARSVEPIGQSFGSFSHWPAAAGIAAIAFAAVQAGRHRSGKQRATLTGLGAGLVFGIQDALTRQTLQILQLHGISGMLHSWSAYCLVATGAVGLLLMQSAFSAGPLHASLPTITAGEPVAGILLGIVVFGDQISLSPASLAMHAGGLAALVVGVILVARAPALSSLRQAVVEPVHLPRRRDTGPQRTLTRASDGTPSPGVPDAPDAPSAAGPGPSPSAAQNRDPGLPVPAEPPTAQNGDRGLPVPAEPPAAQNGDPDLPVPAESPAARNGDPAFSPPPEQPAPGPNGDAELTLPAQPMPAAHPGPPEFALPAAPPTPVPPEPPR
jgi:drug/metabolite transporter (DMT)-like permease